MLCWVSKYNDNRKYETMDKSLIYNATIGNESLSIQFSADMGLIDRADAQTRAFLAANNLSRLAFPACLMMREGMTNAVKHGNRQRPEKMVIYRISRISDHIRMEIEDQGEGFDWQAARKKQPALESDHGRGLAIIEKYSKDYWYNTKGNKLFIML